MYLKPSEIFFSQDSINNVFDKNCGHRYQPIGETLDALCNRSCSVSSIPAISVVKHDNKWFTADNRRLWVFRNLERLGKCEEISVRKTFSIPSSKFTTQNGGVSVCVRNGSPGGFWHRKPSVKRPTAPTPTIGINKIPLSVNDNNNKENVAKAYTTGNDTIDSTGRPPFQELGNSIPDLCVINETSSTQSDTDSDTDTTSTKCSSFGQSTEFHNYENRGYLTSSEESDKSSPHEIHRVEEVSSIVDVVEETAVELDIPPCQNSADEDNNNILTVEMFNANERLSPRSKVFTHTDKKCKPLCFVITAIIVIILLSVLVFVLAKYT